MRCADEVVVLADHSKFGKQSLAFLCELSTVDTLIVDDKLTSDQLGMIDRTDVQLIIAKQSGLEANEFSA